MKRALLILLLLAAWLAVGSASANATGRRLIVFQPTNAVLVSPFGVNYGFSRSFTPGYGFGFYGASAFPVYAPVAPRFVTVPFTDPLTGLTSFQTIDRLTGLPAFGLGY